MLEDELSDWFRDKSDEESQHNHNSRECIDCGNRTSSDCTFHINRKGIETSSSGKESNNKVVK